MEDTRELQPNQLDALREVSNIGAGHAATALSQMIGGRIMISVPRITATRVEDVPEQIGDAENPIAAVLLKMVGDVTGHTLLVFPLPAAYRMAELMMHKPEGSITSMGMMEESAIKEAGNILSSAYMNALSEFMGMILQPSPPHLVVDMAAAVLTTTYLEFSADHDYVFCVESEFIMSETDEKLKGFFLLLPHPASLTKILQAIRVA